MHQITEKSEPLALNEWRDAKRALRQALEHAEYAAELHPNPSKWVGLIPRLRQLIVDFQGE
jgi:hypothetical protein